MYPPLVDAEPVFAYAGLRPAGRGANYVIGPVAGRVRGSSTSPRSARRA